MDRMLKRIVCWAVALMLCVTVSMPARAELTDVIATAKNGVVQMYGIVVNSSGRISSAWCGTGFAVGKAGEDSDVFVTNWHVVTCSGKYKMEDVRLYIVLENATFEDALDETDRVIRCSVLYITEGNPDFAIVQATEPVYGFKALPVRSSDDIKDGATVVALGYPAVIDDVTSTHGGIDDMMVTTGNIARHAVGAWDNSMGTKLLLSSATISGGNSGGPLIDENGAVVGINTYGIGSEASTDYAGAVYIDYALEALDGLNIGYEVYQPPQEIPESEGFPVQKLLLVAAGVIVVLLVVLVVVLLRRPAAKNAIPEVAAQPLVVCTPDGRRLPIPQKGLVIGRDPASCDICLPDDTKGVSRIHCRVAMENGSVMLTDLGSTYGTFLRRQKMPAQMPVAISRGTSFYLGEPDNRFTLL